MVDASIGGNRGECTLWKDMLGCIYPPRKVMIDPSTLHSLPLKEIKSGVVEMIKHGLIADQAFFNYLEEHSEEILNLMLEPLENAIFESCRIKKEIVESDEKDMGKRNILNFGHTVGHALEKLNNYSLGHGEAIAIGILVENHLALQMGHLKQNTFNKIHNIFLKYTLPLQLPFHIPSQSIIDAMKLDKKSLNGMPRFVIIEEIGVPLSTPIHCHPVEEKFIYTALKWMKDDLCSH